MHAAVVSDYEDVVCTNAVVRSMLVIRHVTLLVILLSSLETVV